MKNFPVDCGKQHHRYRIVAECNNNSNSVALAGFCAEERTENILFNHLQNICVQGNGNFGITHTLLNNLVQQWQTTFNIPAAQTLQIISDNFLAEKLHSVLVYKAIDKEERLIKRIFL